MAASDRTPFKRLRVLVAGVNAAQAVLQSHLIEAEERAGREALDAATANLHAYQSRGHGGSHRTKNRTVLGRWAADRSIYWPAEEDRKHVKSKRKMPSYGDLQKERVRWNANIDVAKRARHAKRIERDAARREV